MEEEGEVAVRVYFLLARKEIRVGERSSGCMCTLAGLVFQLVAEKP